jgi:hypothetical protein
MNQEKDEEPIFLNLLRNRLNGSKKWAGLGAQCEGRVHIRRRSNTALKTGVRVGPEWDQLRNQEHTAGQCSSGTVNEI